MKYLGKKSLSSILSGILQVSWYAVLLLSIIAAIIGVIFLFFIPLDDPCVSEFIKANRDTFSMNQNNADWECIKNIPFALKFIILLYFGVVVALMLQIIKKSQHLFNNFKNDIIFNKSNVHIISKISKLIIIFSILTFNFSSIIVGLLLLILCEIFKSGTALQEEHDLTV